MPATEALARQSAGTESKLPPGPQLNSSLFGLWAYRRGRVGFLLNLAKRYGDICYFKIGKQQVFLLNHPEMIKDVLVTNSHKFMKGSALQRAKSLLGEGLLTSEGEAHRSQRRLALPAFHRSRIETYAGVMTAYARRRIDEWSDGQTIDLADEMMQLTLAIVGKTLFDADIEGEANEVGEAITNMLKATDTSSLSSLLEDLFKRLPIVKSRTGTRVKAEFEFAKAKLDRLIYRLIEERRKSSEDRGDLLSMLIMAHDEEDGGSMSDTQLRDELMTIFMTGHETTAVTIAWTFYLLSQNPEVEARLHSELDAVVGKRTPAMSDLGRLPYLEMVLCESMRIYPPAWALQRMAIDECEIAGYIVPKGSMVLMSQYVTHRDTRYFPDPEKFDPERWTQEKRDARPQFSYYPFGGGARRCIGDSFAMMEATLLMVALAQRWQLSVEPNQRIELQPVMSLRPKFGMQMILKAR